MKEELVKLIDEFLVWNHEENNLGSMADADPKDVDIEPSFNDFVKWLKENK